MKEVPTAAALDLTAGRFGDGPLLDGDLVVRGGAGGEGGVLSLYAYIIQTEKHHAFQQCRDWGG